MHHTTIYLAVQFALIVMSYPKDQQAAAITAYSDSVWNVPTRTTTTEEK